MSPVNWRQQHQISNDPLRTTLGIGRILIGPFAKSYVYLQKETEARIDILTVIITNFAAERFGYKKTKSAKGSLWNELEGRKDQKDKSGGSSDPWRNNMQPKDPRFGQPLESLGVYYKRSLKLYEEQNLIEGEERREAGRGQIS